MALCPLEMFVPAKGRDPVRLRCVQVFVGTSYDQVCAGFPLTPPTRITFLLARSYVSPEKLDGGRPFPTKVIVTSFQSSGRAHPAVACLAVSVPGVGLRSVGQ